MSRRPRPEVTPVPRSYEPGYPQTLGPAEFRQWIAVRNETRLGKILLAGSLMFAGCEANAAPPQPAPAQGKPEDRAETVRRLLEGIGYDRSGWFERATFPAPDTAAGPLVPRVPISFGNSYMGIFDAGRARKIALGAFRAYGLEVTSDAQVKSTAGEAHLDGWSEKRRVGFVLREEPRAGVKPAPAIDALRGSGARLHVADAGSYAIYDGDGFTSSVAYLAGVLDFLNAVTDGPDVEVSTLLRGTTRKFTLDDLLCEGIEITKSSPEYGQLKVAKKSTLIIRQEKPAKPGEAAKHQGFSLLLVRLMPSGGLKPLEKAPYARLTVEQKSTGVKFETRALNMFPPAAFDPNRPFEIRVELEPGEYYFQGLLSRTRAAS